MAQLPPKAPNVTPNWANQKSPSMGAFFPSPVGGEAHPSWVDEFLDFSASTHGSHRRSASEGCGEIDGLDVDQLMSMFSDEAPSDNNSINDENSESSETQSACKMEPPGSEPVVDPRRVKRILANRQSAQRSRVRKLHYISELERNVTTLQTEVSTLSPRVAFLDHQRSVLTEGNSHIKQRIAALAQDNIFKDAHQEALKKEIERLRQLYHQQNFNKMVNPSSDHPPVQAEELFS